MNGRKVVCYPESYLPENGWIVPGVASIHLMKTDCGIGMLELFATNPQAGEQERLDACDQLIESAFQQAAKEKMAALVGYTKLPKVISLGLRYGFVYDPEPFYFFRKTLSGDK
jgi:hypothetical protein